MTYISPKLVELPGLRTWEMSNNVAPPEMELACKKVSAKH